MQFIFFSIENTPKLLNCGRKMPSVLCTTKFFQNIFTWLCTNRGDWEEYEFMCSYVFLHFGVEIDKTVIVK